MSFAFHAIPSFPGLLRVDSTVRRDDRGWFMETWKTDAFEAAGLRGPFVQDNTAFNGAAGTLRGLHYQLPPHAQAKLVRCVRGRILDVVVDLRRGSPGFGRWHGETLSGEGPMLWVPAGFAHGYCTLEANSEVAYKIAGAPYTPAAERAIRWDDPALAIRWPTHAPVLGGKDAQAPLFDPTTLPAEW